MNLYALTCEWGSSVNVLCSSRKSSPLYVQDIIALFSKHYETVLKKVLIIIIRELVLVLVIEARVFLFIQVPVLKTKVLILEPKNLN